MRCRLEDTAAIYWPEIGLQVHRGIVGFMPLGNHNSVDAWPYMKVRRATPIPRKHRKTAVACRSCLQVETPSRLAATTNTK